MNPRFSAGLLACAVFFVTAFGVVSDADASTVSGRVVYQANNRPIPGVTVYVVHPSAGRSAPAPTDANGLFSIANVPARNDPYYLEVYWGRTLKFRRSIRVTLPHVVLPDVAL